MFTVDSKVVGILPLFLLLTYQFAISGAVTRNVVTAVQFQHALDKAMPGDVIKLRSDGSVFEGQQFTTSRSGEPGDPIVITGSEGPDGSVSIKLDAQGTTGITIFGDYWIIEGIEMIISEPHVGLKIVGNNNSLSSLLVTAYDTGVSISGSGNMIANSIIRSTNGTGLYLTGDYNNITANVLQGQEWGVYLSNGTCCEEIASNTVHGPVMVHGSNHIFRGDVINGDLLVIDCNNQFIDVIVNSKSPSSLSDSCPPVSDDEINYVH